jgi:hypothetical protein
MDFYGAVILVASIFLIVCLIIMGILMQNIYSNNTFPPTQQPCPDNWKVQGNSCVIPSGNVNVGIISTGGNGFIRNTFGISNPIQQLNGGAISNPLDGNTMINFNDSKWTNLCTQNNWAKTYNINWDGISNLNC